jgi:hypothetical protein
MAALASLAIPAVSIGIPLWLRATARAQQGVLRNRLNTLRTVIGNYTYDKGNAPLSWQDLVREGYLRADPGNNNSTAGAPTRHLGCTRRFRKASLGGGARHQTWQASCSGGAGGAGRRSLIRKTAVDAQRSWQARDPSGFPTAAVHPIGENRQRR